MAGLRVVTRSWWRQAWRYRWACVEVTLVVIAIEIGLKVTDVAHLARWMGVPLSTEHVPPPAIGPDDVSGLTEHEQRLHWALCWVMARWIYDGTCLRRALAFGWVLRRRSPVLRLGMLDEVGVVAHAWIEVEGTVFNAQPVTGTFASGGSVLAMRGSAGQDGRPCP